MAHTLSLSSTCPWFALKWTIDTVCSYNIDSITLQVSKKQTGSGVRGISALEFINSLEVVLRAMSNIEEKLHQSFFFYLLPNDHTFVSHGEYFYAVALLVVPSFMQVLLLLSRTVSHEF